MPAKDLGTKYLCFKCGAKFYDLRKPEPICPKCGADQRTNVPAKTTPAERKARAAAKPIEPVLDEVDAVVLDEEVEVEEADEDADEDDDA
jgi:uncharacterized protein (TIGR02300 family)